MKLKSNFIAMRDLPENEKVQLYAIYGWGYLKCIGMAFLGLEKWKDFSDFPCGKALPNFQLSWKKHQSMDTRVPVYMPLTMQKAKNQWTECMGVHFPMGVSKWRWKLVIRSQTMEEKKMYLSVLIIGTKFWSHFNLSLYLHTSVFEETS